ncbi:ABC transporter ATP-binding protein [Gemmobacter sp.]|uniref:ABC transporter ATP-binding protein n=1 Tax=Gemmobacter sp. TaxID=1898957 RepID=UPI002AFFD0AC|nr:ABC transporter ATP-binding protein [Gemmobacter sp.]
MASLDLANVGKSFGGLKAITDVTFSVPAGEITGLIGPNGAGKSTVVNLITGLLRLSSGRITLDGQDIGAAPPEQVVRLGVARTFQNIRLLTEATVLENVLIGFHRRETASILAALLSLPVSRRETARLREAAMEMLERFEIAHLAHLPAGTLSYGHQRRVEMARAFATDPRILLLDEPVAGMNEVESDSLGRLFRKLADSGVGILLIEHDVKFVSRLSRTVHVLDSGRIIASGKPQEVLCHPDVVAAYLGAEDLEGVA